MVKIQTIRNGDGSKGGVGPHFFVNQNIDIKTFFDDKIFDICYANFSGFYWYHFLLVPFFLGNVTWQVTFKSTVPVGLGSDDLKGWS